MSREEFNRQIAMTNLPVPHELMSVVYSTFIPPAPAPTGDKPTIQPSFGAFPGQKRPVVNPEGSHNVRKGD
jgi:hypothetical protein